MGGCLSHTNADEEVRSKRTYNHRANGGRSGHNYRSTSNHNNRAHNRQDNRKRKIDLNLASVQELSTLPGISQRWAQHIVEYRNAHGPFKRSSDVSNVPGISAGIYNNIKDKVYVSHSHNNQNQMQVNNGYLPKASSLSFRIATWNLKCFGVSRASEKNVLEVVCLAILNNRFDLIAFQELADPDVLKMVCNELNAPKLSSVKRLHSRLHWSQSTSERAGRMFQSSEYNGFLWNDAHPLHLRISGVLGGKPAPNERFVRRPFIGQYEVGHWKFVIVSVHLKATGLDGSDIPQLKHEISLLPTLMEALQDQGHSNIVLVGDFNMDSNDESFNKLRNKGYQNLIPSPISTNINGHNLRGSHQYDNLWVTKRGVLPRHKGVYGIVREGLKINQNETVSDHCPVWADIEL